MLQHRVIPCLIVSALLAPAAMGQTVDFADSRLRSAVIVCGGATGPAHRPAVTTSSILNMTYLTGEAITDLTGLEYALNLRDMALLGAWAAGDWGEPVPTYRGISDLAPIAGLEQLSWVDLADNRIADLAPLSGLANLEVLVLDANRISDVSPLGGLANLWWLHLEDNSIQDIAVLATLTSLQRLYLTGNPLNQAAYDTYLPLIEANNPGIDLRYGPLVPRGDATMDGRVDLDDFAALKNGFGAPGTWRTGDFDGSGVVDLDDFVILKNNFGAVAVPEPASATLLAAGLAASLLRRRRTRRTGTTHEEPTHE